MFEGSETIEGTQSNWNHRCAAEEPNGATVLSRRQEPGAAEIVEGTSGLAAIVEVIADCHEGPARIVVEYITSWVL